MKRKLLTLILIFVFALSLGLSGCNTKEKIHIVYLGDSIGEGIAGIRPVSERERDAYYGIVGIRNGYDFKNRAISGSRSRNLLALLKEPDDGIRMTQSLIRSADIIHVSILGNDLLLANLARMISTISEGDFSYIQEIADTARDNIAEIVEILKDYNPDAVLLMQPVYNPLYPESTLITPAQRAELATYNIQPSQYREFLGVAVSMVNASMHDYLEEHPGSYYIIDAYAEFDRVFAEDEEEGKHLIFVDAVHPSAEGHAVMADLIQEQLEELGLADKQSALAKYKKMRISQLERLYKESFDIKPAKAQIKKAESCSEVTAIYFDAIRGQMPDYY
ncbi:MAG: SGNH/GDSL hydrolase family protein [Christensenellales bacterium]